MCRDAIIRFYENFITPISFSFPGSDEAAAAPEAASDETITLLKNYNSNSLGLLSSCNKATTLVHVLRNTSVKRITFNHK